MVTTTKSVFANPTFTLPAQPAVTTSEKYWGKAGVKWMGETFRAQFMGLEVPEVSEGEFLLRPLVAPTQSSPVVEELGDKAETPVSQLHAFMDANRGKPGWFPTFAVGNDGRLWTVNFGWSGGSGGWRVGASPVGDPSEWYSGYQVLSRN